MTAALKHSPPSNLEPQAKPAAVFEQIFPDFLPDIILQNGTIRDLGFWCHLLGQYTPNRHHQVYICELAKQVGVDAHTASNHLNTLRDIGVIEWDVGNRVKEGNRWSHERGSLLVIADPKRLRRGAMFNAHGRRWEAVSIKATVARVIGKGRGGLTRAGLCLWLVSKANLKKLTTLPGTHIAEKTKTHPNTVSRVLKELAFLELIERRGQRIKLLSKLASPFLAKPSLSIPSETSQYFTAKDHSKDHSKGGSGNTTRAATVPTSATGTPSRSPPEQPPPVEELVPESYCQHFDVIRRLGGCLWQGKIGSLIPDWIARIKRYQLTPVDLAAILTETLKDQIFDYFPSRAEPHMRQYRARKQRDLEKRNRKRYDSFMEATKHDIEQAITSGKIEAKDGRLNRLWQDVKTFGTKHTINKLRGFLKALDYQQDDPCHLPAEAILAHCRLRDALAQSKIPDMRDVIAYHEHRLKAAHRPNTV